LTNVNYKFPALEHLQLRKACVVLNVQVISERARSDQFKGYASLHKGIVPAVWSGQTVVAVPLAHWKMDHGLRILGYERLPYAGNALSRQPHQVRAAAVVPAGRSSPDTSPSAWVGSLTGRRLP